MIELRVTLEHIHPYEIELPINSKEFEDLREEELLKDYILSQLSYQQFIEEVYEWRVYDYEILSIDDPTDEE